MREKGRRLNARPRLSSTLLATRNGVDAKKKKKVGIRHHFPGIGIEPRARKIQSVLWYNDAVRP